MVKRPKWSKKPGDPGEPAVSNPSNPFWELATDHRSRPWLEKIPDDPRRNFNDEWIKAFEDIDQRDDQTHLVELLQARFPVTDDVYWHLADLLTRRQLKKKRGAQKTPSYERTDTDVALDEADGQVRELISQGIPVEDALDRVSRSHGIPIQILSKKHRSIR
jgi:hypothetical protein